MTPGPLAGIRILEVGTMPAGPYATMLLADLGADVTKIEPPGGDISRKVGDSYFASLNRGKRSICLDLTSEAGQQRLRPLGVPAAAVRTLGEALSATPEMIVTAGDYRLVASPIRVTGYNPTYGPPPQLGQHGQ